jgi:hypothetical protein
MDGNDALSFVVDIKPLFREGDRQSMTFAFDLWAYEDVRANADAIIGRLREGPMPCDSAWPREQVETFQRWIDSGAPE